MSIRKYAKAPQPLIDGGQKEYLHRELTKLENTTDDLIAAVNLSVNVQSGGSYTLLLSDQGKVIETNNGSANTLTVPPNASVSFPVGAIIAVTQLGAGQTTITPGSGVTLRQWQFKFKTAGQYARASMYQRAVNEWVLSGDLTV